MIIMIYWKTFSHVINLINDFFIYNFISLSIILLFYAHLSRLITSYQLFLKCKWFYLIYYRQWSTHFCNICIYIYVQEVINYFNIFIASFIYLLIKKYVWIFFRKMLQDVEIFCDSILIIIHQDYLMWHICFKSFVINIYYYL